MEGSYEDYYFIDMREQRRMYSDRILLALTMTQRCWKSQTTSSFKQLWAQASVERGELWTRMCTYCRNALELPGLVGEKKKFTHSGLKSVWAFCGVIVWSQEQWESRRCFHWSLSPGTLKLLSNCWILKTQPAWVWARLWDARSCYLISANWRSTVLSVFQMANSLFGLQLHSPASKAASEFSIK